MHIAAVQYAQMDEPHERLQRARALAGYETATAAAEVLHPTATSTYLAHENGSRGFKAEAERYARFFKVSFEWLATGRGEPRFGSLDARVLALPDDDQRQIHEYIEFIEAKRAAALKRTGT